MLDVRPSLGWPQWNAETAYIDFDPTTRDVDFEVTIAVPACSSTDFVQLVVDAAEMANIPNVYPVLEPACAVQYLLQKDVESLGSTNLLDGCVLILDIGGGTADLQTLSITDTIPMRMKEVVQGDGK